MRLMIMHSIHFKKLISMRHELKDLENIITKSLISSSTLNNSIIQKDLEKQDLLKEIALSIIDVLDSFENIESILAEKELDKIEDVSRTMKRYQSVKKKLLLILQKHGITKIEFPDNRLVLGICEVIETEVDNSKKDDEIVSIVRNGYIRGNELIRAAQLIIVKN